MNKQPPGGEAGQPGAAPQPLPGNAGGAIALCAAFSPGNGSQFAAGLHPVDGGIQGVLPSSCQAALGSAGLDPCLSFPT